MGEEWSGESVGLEVDEQDLLHEQKRAYKRSQFVSGLTQAGTNLVSRSVPVLAGAQAVARRLQEHSKQITDLQRSLDQAVGSTGTHNRRRMLTRKRRLLLVGLRKFPDLAEEMWLPFPQVDVECCTMCGDCAKACTLQALQLDDNGRVVVEPAYCVCCGACAVACPEDAIAMRDKTCEELVVPDEEAEARKRKARRAAKAREQGKQTLKKGLDIIEGLSNDE
jgi:ferredoxin